jgi:hypothetical protein
VLLEGLRNLIFGDLFGNGTHDLLDCIILSQPIHKNRKILYTCSVLIFSLAEGHIVTFTFLETTHINM